MEYIQLMDSLIVIKDIQVENGGLVSASDLGKATRALVKCRKNRDPGYLFASNTLHVWLPVDGLSSGVWLTRLTVNGQALLYLHLENGWYPIIASGTEAVLTQEQDKTRLDWLNTK